MKNLKASSAVEGWCFVPEIILDGNHKSFSFKTDRFIAYHSK